MSVTLLAHSPWTETARDEEITELNARGCPGQKLSLSFSVASSEAVRIVVPATSLSDPYWVKVWNQSGLALPQGPPRSYPELLLKSDREPLGGRAPEVRLEGAACFDVTSAQQVWLAVTLPTSPGSYVEILEVLALSPFRPVASLRLNLEVLPLTLPEPRADRLLWYRGTLDPGQHHVSADTMRRQLGAIARAGFCSFTNCEKRLQNAQKMLDLAQEVGLTGNAVMVEPHPPEALFWGKLKPLYYLSDECDGHGPEMLANHRRLHAQLSGRVPTMASLLSPQSARQLGPAPDVLSFSVTHSTTILHSLRYFRETYPGKAYYYYWPAHLEKPGLQRLLAGLALWWSGAEGISPYCYQHMPVESSDPFDDRDPWEPDFVLGGVRQNLRHHLAVYPARRGEISTVQWEGLREGLVDLRYLQAWESRFGKREESRKAIERLISAIDFREISPADDRREPFEDCLDRLRDALIDELLT